MIVSPTCRFVGVDVGKTDLFVAIQDAPGVARYDNSDEGVASLIADLPPQAEVGFEATGGCEYALWAALEGAGLPARQLPPAQVKAFAKTLGREAKTDALDARLIVEFMAFRPGAGRRFEGKTIRRIKGLASLRRQMVEFRKTLRCQQAQAVDDEIEAHIAAHLCFVADRIAVLDRRLENLIKDDAALARKATLLRSIPGVGPIACLTLLTEMPELGDLGGKQAAALAGLAPFARDSGSKRGRRSIRGGRKHVRSALHMAALAAARHHPDLKIFAAAMKARNAPPMKILTAVARKLVVLSNAVLKRQTPWEKRNA